MSNLTIAVVGVAVSLWIGWFLFSDSVIRHQASLGKLGCGTHSSGYKSWLASLKMKTSILGAIGDKMTGYKTYLAAVAMVLFAVYGISGGHIDQAKFIELMTEAAGMAGLRHAITTQIPKQ